MNQKNTQNVAQCPHCKKAFHYVEVKFVGGINDQGGWTIKCEGCRELFNIHILNPIESSAEKNWQIVNRHDDLPIDDDNKFAEKKVVHNIPRSKVYRSYNLSSPALYICKKCHQALDTPAYDALRAEKKSLQSAWINAENYLLAANGPSSDWISVSIEFKCNCLEPHRALFRAQTSLGASAVPMFERCLLVHVTNADLPYRLSRLASKSDIMDLLEKLLIRWQLCFEKVILATPFIGHQWMSAEQIEEIWSWLLKNLDPTKVFLISRSATFKAFKNISQESGFNFDELKEYDLEDKIISGALTKQNFHAKFFAGISNDFVEVLSGSANLLRGPSIENISFGTMGATDFKENYLDVIDKHPTISGSTRLGDVLFFDNGQWVHTVIDKHILTQ